jgi:hypothetical protein
MRVPDTARASPARAEISPVSGRRSRPVCSMDEGWTEGDAVRIARMMARVVRVVASASRTECERHCGRRTGAGRRTGRGRHRRAALSRTRDGSAPTRASISMRSGAGQGRDPHPRPRFRRGRLARLGRWHCGPRRDTPWAARGARLRSIAPRIAATGCGLLERLGAGRGATSGPSERRSSMILKCSVRVRRLTNRARHQSGGHDGNHRARRLHLLGHRHAGK